MEDWLEHDADYSDSPFIRFLDTQLEEWREGYVRIGLVLLPNHLNRSGVIHGGLLATLLDHAGGLSGLYSNVPGKRRYGVSVSVTSNFLAQSKAGKLTVTGELVSGGRKIYFARSEVRTDTGILLATGSSVHRYRSGSEPPQGTRSREEISG